MALALLLAAGSGERLGAGAPKAFVELGGRPMLEWSLEALRQVPAVERIVVALPDGEVAPAGTDGVRGGSCRSESVRNALAASGSGDPVVVHDAARPVAGADLFERTLAELDAGGCDGAVAAAPVADTVKIVGEDRGVRETLDRSSLWAAQTPQAFRRETLKRALDVPADVLAAATDDAWLVERSGGRVRVVEAPAENVKVTTAADLQVADLLLRQRHHIAVVREIIAAVNAGRMEDPFVHYHDDVVWDLSASQFMPGEWDDIYQGHERLRNYWRSWLSAWETVHFETDDLFAVGSHVVQFQRQRVRGRQSGVELEMPTYAQVWSFRGDKIAAMRFFADRGEAVRFARSH